MLNHKRGQSLLGLLCHMRKFATYFSFLMLCFFASSRAAAQNDIPIGRYAVAIDTIQVATGGKVLVEAGRLGVLEDRTKPNGRVISIAYRRFKTSSVDPAPPVFMLAGGPGASWINSLSNEERMKEVQFYQTFSDVVVFDQRGAGQSIPNLACEGRERLSMDKPFSYDLLKPSLLSLAERCQEKWKAEGVDLSAYNTDENAADVSALIQALGYQKVILVGGSYGSHLGLHIMRKFPDRVDRAIFYGIEGPDHTWDSPSGRWAALQRIASAAESSAYYKGKIPKGGLLKALQKVIERLDKKPEQVTLERKGQRREVLVTKEIVQAIASYRAGKRSQAEVWPNLILAMYQGDFQLPAMASMGMRSIPAPDAMAKSMDFASGISKTRRKQLLKDPVQEWLGDINWDYTLLADHWPVPDLGDAFRADVHSDIPTLLVHGTWDISTPLENAEEVLKGLANGQLIQVKGGGHGALYNLYEHWPAIYPLLENFVLGEAVSFPTHVDLGSVEYPNTKKEANPQLWDGAKTGDLSLVKKALAMGADIQALDMRSSKTGRRAMNWAAFYNRLAVLEYLIAQGADLNATNRSGFTPLHHAVENNAVEAAQLLLQAGADKTIPTKRGVLPIETAKHIGNKVLVKLLEK